MDFSIQKSEKFWMKNVWSLYSDFFIPQKKWFILKVEFMVHVFEEINKNLEAPLAETDTEETIDMSPSRFSSNSINTVILNPGAVSLTSLTGQETNDLNNSSPHRESQIFT